MAETPRKRPTKRVVRPAKAASSEAAALSGESDAPSHTLLVKPAIRDPSALLTDVEKAEFLELISRGSPRSSACRELGLTLQQLQRTLTADRQFDLELEQVGLALNQNVETALYHAAMKGNVSAQTLWLRKRPPPGWLPDEAETRPTDDFERMTDAELIALARSQGIAVPVEFAAELERESGAPFSGCLPG